MIKKMLAWCFVFNIHKVGKMSSLTPTLLVELWGGHAAIPCPVGEGWGGGLDSWPRPQIVPWV